MKVHGKRALLNRPGFESTAAIVAEIEDTSSWREGKNGDGTKIESRYHAAPECTLRISDCDRAISLYFTFTNTAEWRNSLRKIDVLIDALSEFRDGMEYEHEQYKRRVKGLKTKP